MRRAGRWGAWLRRAFIALVPVGTVCVAYGYLVEPYWPEVTHVRITSSRLSSAGRPVRVVLLSDMHSDPSPRLEDRLPGLIAAEHPDLVVYTGDSINSLDALPVFRRCMTQIARIAPTFAVRGNWDAWYWPDVDLFGGTGVRELDGHAARVDLAETTVWVAGIAVEHETLAKPALDEVPAGALTLFLYHYPYPDVLPEADWARVDLFCAGHTHGGQVALPFYGAIVTMSKYGKRYEAGLYRLARTWMYVNRGIGLEGGSAPRVRFCARPEITVVEIEPKPAD
jgi:uncharacterized protein